MKELYFVSGEIKTPPFSFAARHEAGKLLRQFAVGETLSLPHSRPMPSIGAGVHELRVRDANANWWIVYHLGARRIVILKIFAKKTEKTPPDVIENCKRRLARYLQTEKHEVKEDEGN